MLFRSKDCIRHIMCEKSLTDTDEAVCTFGEYIILYSGCADVILYCGSQALKMILYCGCAENDIILWVR